MAYLKSRLILSTVVLLIASPVSAQTSSQSQEQIAREIMKMPWVEGSGATVDDIASIDATSEARVLNGDGANRFIQLSGNPPLDGSTIVAPKDLHWFSVYHYHDVGYVSDKDAVDPDALMKQLKDEEPAQNSEREKMGLDDLTIAGWAVKPHYDPTTHDLEWGLKIHSSNGSDVINYTTRHLGRGGYTNRQCAAVQEAYRQAMKDYRDGR
jgi:uncharacterized membrane-anchored protein